MEVVNQRCCGLDVGKDEVVACVRDAVGRLDEGGPDCPPRSSRAGAGPPGSGSRPTVAAAAHRGTLNELAGTSPLPVIECSDMVTTL